MATSTALRFTYQDYLLLPEDRRYEVIDGDLFHDAGADADEGFRRAALAAASDTLRSETLPGLEIPLTAIF